MLDVSLRCRIYVIFASVLLLVFGSLGFGSVANATPSLAPSPTGDSYLDLWPRANTSMQNGEILSSRSVALTGPLVVTINPKVWQLWFKTTTADGRPTTALTTVLKPANWNGSVVSNNYAIDALGLKCNPSYQLTRGFAVEVPDITRQLLARGYAVVMTDYQGGSMAYGHGPTQAPIVLDGIRAALGFPAAGLQGSAVAMTGYSGGAIATGWAAQLQPTYAPELALAGVVMGGTPADLSLLGEYMDGKVPASGLYLLAALGVARVTSGAPDLLNPIGVQLAQGFKDSCVEMGFVAGVLPLPLSTFTNQGLYDNDVVRQVLHDTRMGGIAPTVPVLLFHGQYDLWIPIAGAETLYDDWASLGADVSFLVVPGEHITGAFDPRPLDQLDEWLQMK